MLLNFNTLNFKIDSDSESEYDEWHSNSEEEDEKTEQKKRKKSSGRPKIDDNSLRFYAHMIDNLDKLIISIDNNNEQENTLPHVDKCLEFEENESSIDQNYMMYRNKQLVAHIVKYFFRAESSSEGWSLMNNTTVRRKTKLIYSNIKLTRKRLKHSLSDLMTVSYKHHF